MFLYLTNNIVCDRLVYNLRSDKMEYLMKQYLLTLGIKNIVEISDEFLSEFYEWLLEYKEMSKEYINFLDYLDLDYKEKNTVEVGKGKFDSIVIPYKTNIITKDKKIKGVEEDRIINGSLKICHNEPMLINKNEVKRLREVLPNVNTYMTQNLFGNDIASWSDIHNSLTGNIILGVYGNVNDKDREDKIKMLQTLKLCLTSDDFKEEYTRWNDNYYYVIGSLKKRLFKK